MVAKRKIVIEYTPRDQFIDFHERTQRWALLVCHRRAGKTVACINDDIRDCLRSTHWRTGEPLKNYRAAYLAPTYTQAKAVAWDYVKQFCRPIPGVKFNESELRVDFPNGARYRLFGAENYDAMRGLYFDKVTLDEPADMDPRAFPEVIRPALSDREGRAAFIGTPKGHNDFYDRAKDAVDDDDWYFMVLKASETGILADTELASAKKTMSEDQYEQEYECSFEAAIVGAYYGKEMKAIEAAGRIMEVAHDPHLPVHTFWDLGIDDSTAIGFVQQLGRTFQFIDFYENHDMPISHYVQVLQERAHVNGYVYGEHYLPHDTKARDLSTGKSREEALWSLGMRPSIPSSSSPIADGIEGVRRVLRTAYFDKLKCDRLIEALKNYQREWDAKLKTFRQRPKHDWSSHPCDAIREFATQHAEEQFMQEDEETDRRVSNTDRSGRNASTGY